MNTLGGRYQILEQIGKGGFGVTFLAEDMQRPGNPKCVVKQFKPMATDPYTLKNAKRLFDNEAVTLEALGKHDQIPQLLAHFEENQEFYLVQEYIKGHDLSQELLPGRKLSEADVIKLLQDILQVLTFVHEQSVIHRDIKPSNIRRREDDKIVLIDFGAVKEITTQIANSQGHTSSTVVIGTPGYMPSEQSNGNPDFRSDIYAVGIIGIQALTGIFPVQLPKDNTGEILWRNQAQVSPELADIIDKMVRYDFRQRYQSAELALQALQPQLQTLSPTNINPRSSNRQWKKWLILLATVGAIAIVIITINKLTPPSPPPPFIDYADSEVKIEIEYPQNWQRQDLKNPITGEWVKFLSPKQTNTDNFQEQVTIRIENFTGTLEDYKNEFIKEIQSSADSQIINSNTTTLAYRPAYQLIYTVKHEENNLKNLQVWTLQGEKAYIITYTGTQADYDKFVQIAEQMIQSFKIN